MKLSHKEVEVLVATINPTIENYREYIAEGSGDHEDIERFNVLRELQKRLEVWHETTLQLERE
jgi:hypothetical protein